MPTLEDLCRIDAEITKAAARLCERALDDAETLAVGLGITVVEALTVQRHALQRADDLIERAIKIRVRDAS